MSDLLNQASLVMVPSGYKEDIVYSVVPSDGSGDLSFTRASNGTRINSAGLVEVTPWNMVEYSEQFDNGVWTTSDVTVTANTTIAPNGTTTADTINAIATGQRINQTISVTASTSYTFSFYAKKGTMTTPRYTVFDLSNSAFILQQVDYSSLINSSSWERVTATFTTPLGCTSIGIYPINGVTTLGTIFLWGAQLNIGSTAKPYFPTTDRLNVPRLTYQNGGGGCPSLLLEKQSTNLITYSEQFDNAAWTQGNGGGTASVTVTANYGISPDGTQNADRIQLNKGNTGYAEIYQLFAAPSGTTYTQTLWLKSLSGTPKINFGFTGTSRGTITLTTEWQRYTLTYVSGASPNGVALTLFDGFDPTTAQSIDILAWGAQAEESSYATSYIPTTSSSATRVADACYKTGISSLFGTNQGTFFIDFIYNNSNQFDYLFDVTDSSNTNRFLMYDTNGSGLYNFYDSGYSEITTYQFTKGQRYKIAVKYNSSGTIWYVNGVLSATGTVSFANQMSQIYLGTRFSLTNNVNMQVNETIVFPTALSGTELISLTTI